MSKFIVTALAVVMLAVAAPASASTHNCGSFKFGTRRLPVVAVDDVRALAGLQQELERRLAEEREALRIIIRPVDVAAVKEVVRRVRLDEEALAALDKTEEHPAMDRADVSVQLGWGT